VSPDGSLVLVTGDQDTPLGDYDILTEAFDARSGASVWRSRYRMPGEETDETAFWIALSPDGHQVFVGGATCCADSRGYLAIAYDLSSGTEANDHWLPKWGRCRVWVGMTGWRPYGKEEAMNRAAGTGLMALGAVMAAVGAILEFAVSVDTEGFNINTIGLILLIIGIVLFVVGIAALAMGSSRRTTVRQDVRSTPAGRSSVEEVDDHGTG
jgi:hypothetical protein